MPVNKVIDIHPRGWENDEADEYLKLGLLDYCVAQVYMSFGIFFKLSDSDNRNAIVDTVHQGLEVTLSQCRQLCGNLEAHPDGGLCFHKKKDSTVELHVQWLDGPDDVGQYPTFEDFEKGGFTAATLGNLDTWCVAPMTYGEKPEAEPRSNPKVSAFKLSFVRGGMVLIMHHHHYANDINGWAGELHQLAENCAAIWKSPDNPAYPPWDPACLDYSAVSKPAPKTLVEGPQSPPRHPDHKDAQWLLFHLSKSKAAEIKKLATPADGSFWVSSWDAFTAYIWRILSKHRARLFNPDLSGKMLWGEAADMRTRMHNPKVAERIQGNIVYVPMSTSNPTPQPTIGEVISEAPLSTLARYIRQLTNSATQENMDASLNAVAPVRDKTALFLRTDGFPPMSNIMIDWRPSKPYEADFGFGKPYALRHPFGTVTNGLLIVYPERTSGGPAGVDEGNEILIGFEKEATGGLLEDPEWNRYFEFRGVDGQEKLHVETVHGI